MKRAITILLALLFALSLAACGDSSSSPTPTPTEAATTPKSTPAQTSPTPAATPEKEKDSYEVGEANVLVYKNSIGTFWVQISVPVKNTGDANLYLSSGTIDLEDSSGHLVESFSLVSVYPQVLKPGETAWYYEETTLDSEPESELKAIPHVSVKKATVECIRYSVSDLAISDDTYGGIKITGRAENVTEEDESMPYVVAFMYDSNDQLLGQAFTIMDDLKAGDKMGFSMTTFGSNPAFKAENVARYEVIAYPMQFQFN